MSDSVVRKGNPGVSSWSDRVTEWSMNSRVFLGHGLEAVLPELEESLSLEARHRSSFTAFASALITEHLEYHWKLNLFCYLCQFPPSPNSLIMLCVSGATAFA